MDTVVIRKSVIEDMQGVMEAHRRSIRELCSGDYSFEQIEVWSAVKYSRDIWERSVNEEYHLVLTKLNHIEGFCHACMHSNGVGEIRGLYFTKAIAGQGYGRQAFEKSMKFLRGGGVQQVIVTATRTAMPFYEKMGFDCVSESTLNIRGTDLGCYNMAMNL